MFRSRVVLGISLHVIQIINEFRSGTVLELEERPDVEGNDGLSRRGDTRCPLGGAFASVIGLVVMIPHGSRVVVSTNVTCHPFPTTIRKRPSTNVSSPSGEVRPKAAMIRSAMRDTAFPR